MKKQINYVTLDMSRVDLDDPTQRIFMENYMKKSVQMFRKYYPDNNYEAFRHTFDEDNLVELMKNWSKTKTFVYLACYTDPINILAEEEVVGIYVLQLFPSIVEKRSIGQELHFMVDPNFSGALIGPKLLRMGVETAKEHDCLWIDNFNTLGHKQDKAAILYKRVGGKKIGEIYRTNV